MQRRNVDHGIFIEYRNQVVQLPVNPPEVELMREANNNTTEIVQLGEINRLGLPNLAECIFESFLPTDPSESFVRTRSRFRMPDFYDTLFTRILREGKPCRLIITGTRINMMASVESWDIKHKGANGEIYYLIKFKQFRSHQAREVRINMTPPRPAQPPRPRATTTQARSASTNQQITVGSTVIVNGRLHRDSFGAGPGQTERNAIRRISHHVPGRRFPFHVKTLDGGWRGWVTADSVRLR